MRQLMCSLLRDGHGATDDVCMSNAKTNRKGHEVRRVSQRENPFAPLRAFFAPFAVNVKQLNNRTEEQQNN